MGRRTEAVTVWKLLVHRGMKGGRKNGGTLRATELWLLTWRNLRVRNMVTVRAVRAVKAARTARAAALNDAER